MVQPGPNDDRGREAQYTPGRSRKSLTAVPQWDAAEVEQVLFYERVYRDVYDTAWAECRGDGICESLLVLRLFSCWVSCSWVFCVFVSFNDRLVNDGVPLGDTRGIRTSMPTKRVDKHQL